MPLRDLPGYYPEILDGGLGVLPPSTAGLFGVVGESQKGTTSIKFATDPDDVAEEYGLGSLAERVYDAFTNRAVQLGIRRPTPTIAGSVSPVTQKAVGNPTTAGGKAAVAAGKNLGVDHPYNNRWFIIRITAGGKLSEARYQLSCNNGVTFGPELKFVKTGEDSGKPVSTIDMGNGTYIQFTEEASPDESDSFVAGDEYRWSTTASKATSNEILDSVADLINWTDPNGGQGFEYIYVATFPSITTTTRDDVKTGIEGFLADLASKAQMLWTQDSRPIWIMVDMPSIEETRPDDQDEWNFDEWMELLNDVSASSRDVRISVNAGYALLTQRGEMQIRPVGGCLAGLVSNAKLHHSVGWVRYMKIVNSVRVEPYHPQKEGYKDYVTAVTGTLDNFPVVPWSLRFEIDETGGVPEKTIIDGGDGKLYDAGTNCGTINYETGAFTITGITPDTSNEAYYLYYSKEEVDKGKLAQLNDARYISLRNWIGYGRIATDDWMFAPATSDFYCIRNRRIMDEAVRMVGIANVPYTNSPGISDRDMAAYKADLSRPLEAMKITEENTDKPIMDYALTLTPDANIWSNGIVHCKVEIVPTPTKKKLEATFQLRTKIEE
jgi:hypothetical protein